MEKKKVFDEKLNENIYKSNYYTKKYNKLHNYTLTKKLLKYIDFLAENCYKKIGDLSVRGYYSLEPMSFNDKTLGDKLRLSIGSSYAKTPFACIWLNISGNIDESIDVDNVVFKVDFGGEGIVVDNEGNQLQAISCFNNDYDDNFIGSKNNIILNNNFITNGQISFWIDASYNGIGKNSATINTLDICLINKQIASIYYDLQVILSIYNYANSSYQQVIEAKLNNLGLFEILDLTEENVAKIKDTFNQIIGREHIDDVFKFSLIGNSNIDIAWLCPISESYRKATRTFIKQLNNISLYDGYVFGASQAQVYSWIKNKNPALFEQIKQKVLEGSWEILGSTWVDMDSKLISAESLIRQIYYGKQFFNKYFNVDSKLMWLPSSYGCSSSLPQVMKQGNVPYLVINKFDNIKENIFNYKGNDNSTVLAHIMPVDSVNNTISASRLMYSKDEFVSGNNLNKSLITCGMSNGSLGASFEQLETVKRLQNVQPLPQISMDKASNFFSSLVNSKAKFETYEGEIDNVEYEGGSSTNHYTKFFNRKIEFMLRNYEVLVAQLGIEDENLPISHKDLEEIWKEVLLYQSQKIINGDAIPKVYEDILVKYDVIYNKLKYSINELLKNCKVGNFNYNPNSFDCEYTYKHEDKWYVAEIPAFNMVEKDKGKQITAFYGIAAENHIENKMYKIAFKNGEIVSLYDKYYNKEFVKKDDSMVAYKVYSDDGTELTFADDFVKYGSNMRCIAFETVKNGPVVQAKITFKKGKIKVDEVVSITDGKEGVDIEAKISFFDKNKMLFTNFATNLRATEYCYNTQIGHIKQKSSNGLSIKTADKFVDISNHNFGLSLITDCKYGYINDSSDIAVCLIRSPKGSKERIDNGNFEVKMQILPHHSMMDKNTYKQAYLLNNPIIEATGNKKSTIKKLCSDNENIIIESVKTDIDGKVIVRAYNATDKIQTANITFGRRIQKKVADILDNKIEDIKGELKFNPFELKNILFD